MVRSKHRYISFAIISVKLKEHAQVTAFNTTNIYSAVLSKVKKMHGDFGFATVKTGLICQYCNDMTRVAIIKVRRGSHKFVSTVLPFIAKIGKESVQLHTIRITSTLHQAYKHLKVYQRKQFEIIWNSLDESEIETVKKKFDNLEKMEKMLIEDQQVREKNS